MYRVVVIANCFVEGTFHRLGEELDIGTLNPGLVDVYYRVLYSTEPEPKRKKK